MIGTDEPPLRPLDSGTATWLGHVMTAVDPRRLRATVEALPAPRCRCHWPEAMARADALIRAAFEEAGCRIQERGFAVPPTGWRRPLEVHDPARRGSLAGLNVLGIREGRDGEGAIVVGAHHDTVPQTGGADDNSASVAALLELARVLAPYRFRHTLIFAAFDMEELGLLGSRAIVPGLAREWRILGAVIYETMAYTTRGPDTQKIPAGLGGLYPAQIRRIRARQSVGDWTLVLYREQSRPLACAFAEGLIHLAGRDASILVRDASDLPVLGWLIRLLVPTLLHFSRSDHLPFWQAGLPAIMVTDTANFRNPHYHRPSDRPDTLDYGRLSEIVGATAVALARIAEVEPPR